MCFFPSTQRKTCDVFVKQDVLLMVNQRGPPPFEGTSLTKEEHGETVWGLELVYLLTVTCEFTLPKFVIQICGDFMETSRFSSGEITADPSP